MNIKSRSKLDQAFGQCRAAPKMATLDTASANYDFCCTGKPRVLSNLCRHIFAVRCDDSCPKLFCELDVVG